MKAVHDTADRTFLTALQRIGQASVSQLCSEIGVTATAVRQRLTRLLALGWIARSVVRGERGRPHHLYSVTNDGLSQLGDNYRELAILLWKQIQSLDEPELKSKLLEKVRQAFVAAYGQGVEGDGVGTRMEQLRNGLASRGFDVELEEGPGSLPVLKEHACPYHELAEKDSSICDLEQTVFAEIVGVPLERSRCCLEGHTCCEFQPVAG